MYRIQKKSEGRWSFMPASRFKYKYEAQQALKEYLSSLPSTNNKSAFRVIFQQVKLKTIKELRK
jgi:hypothetical protein